MRKLSSVNIISEQDKQLLTELKNVVGEHVPDAQVALYGSAARGSAGPDSDYDILILTKRKLSSSRERELREAVYELGLNEQVLLSLAIYSKDEWKSPVFRGSPYRKNVIKEGIIV
ncbi:nucleotidyltransferase domain-containing protein [bacterium]|nr:nucleotidyltransferase domain-containing protein [bacterium]